MVKKQALVGLVFQQLIQFPVDADLIYDDHYAHDQQDGNHSLSYVYILQAQFCFVKIDHVVSYHIAILDIAHFRTSVFFNSTMKEGLLQ